ncbi:MAG: hypothetical protein KIT84_02020 [Labilithrix sp.]|nr:hypothetical protein [Labilithrix sp.]MCW5809765.1 hypothetical protein [Labilithrix sp.]
MRRSVVSLLFVAAAGACTAPRAPPAPLLPAPAVAMPRPYRQRLAVALARNTTCVGCHEQEAAEWRGSMHRHAFDNPAFQAALAFEPSPFCRGCHAPESDAARAPEPAVAALGVSCVTCHVTDEDGAVLAAPSPRRGQRAAPHAVLRSAAFAQTAGCASCHEFAFPAAPHDDDDAHFMQTTLREHARSPAAAEACASCHMPLVEGRRSHAFAETRDAAWLKDRLAVHVELVEGRSLRLTLTQRTPGHAFPTGDLFRRLEVGAERRDDGDRVLGREVRHLARRFQLVPGHSARALLGDDRVFDTPQVVDLPIAPGAGERVAWWVTYQRVATVFAGDDPAAAKIESEVPLHDGVLP